MGKVTLTLLIRSCLVFGSYIKSDNFAEGCHFGGGFGIRVPLGNDEGKATCIQEVICKDGKPNYVTEHTTCEDCEFRVSKDPKTIFPEPTSLSSRWGTWWKRLTNKRHNCHVCTKSVGDCCNCKAMLKYPNGKIKESSVCYEHFQLARNKHRMTCPTWVNDWLLAKVKCTACGKTAERPLRECCGSMQFEPEEKQGRKVEGKWVPPLPPADDSRRRRLMRLERFKRESIRCQSS